MRFEQTMQAYRNCCKSGAGQWNVYMTAPFPIERRSLSWDPSQKAIFVALRISSSVKWTKNVPNPYSNVSTGWRIHILSWWKRTTPNPLLRRFFSTWWIVDNAVADGNAISTPIESLLPYGVCTVILFLASWKAPQVICSYWAKESPVRTGAYWAAIAVYALLSQRKPTEVW